MAPKYKDKEVGELFTFNGSWVSWAHTVIAYSKETASSARSHSTRRLASGAILTAAFLSALVVGIRLHYHKILQNEFYGYPDEWFPSVSATIGDRYPERSFFMIFIAITSGMQSYCA